MKTTNLQSSTLWAYLQLMRPANIITAWADILAGFAASNFLHTSSSPTNHIIPLLWLILSTTGLYGGGIVFNDIFDAELDATERPERPIPSGRASKQEATVLGVILLIVAIIAAWQVSSISALLATLVAFAALFYDSLGKHQGWLGPLNMGICRGGNLLLGVSVVPALVTQVWFIAIIPIIYIGAITAISQGEVQGGKTSTGIIAIILMAIVMGSLLALGLFPDYHPLPVIPLVILLTLKIFPPFLEATKNPNPAAIQIAVRTGVISLIILDSALATGFGGIIYGLLVLSLLPLSASLGKLFSVT